MAERLIFHVDVNSAYLSWEATRRVKNGEEDLRLVPSAIGGDPKSRRGVVLAKSIPAKIVRRQNRRADRAGAGRQRLGPYALRGGKGRGDSFS